MEMGSIATKDSVSEVKEMGDNPQYFPALD
jgi:hypothetical protein